MELMVNRLKARSKRYFLLLLAFPIVLGIIGWVLPVGKELSTYTAETTISLGHYENNDLNNSKNVITLLTNIPFYQEHLPGLSDTKRDEIVSKLQVTTTGDNIIKLSYTDFPKEKAIKVIDEISTAFLQLDQSAFQEKQKIIQDSIDGIKGERVSDDTKVDQQRFLFELKTDQLNMKPASLLQPVNNSNVEVENKALNSKERAVAGVLIGIIFALLWILLPELVREQS